MTSWKMTWALLKEYFLRKKELMPVTMSDEIAIIRLSPMTRALSGRVGNSMAEEFVWAMKLWVLCLVGLGPML